MGQRTGPLEPSKGRPLASEREGDYRRVGEQKAAEGFLSLQLPYAKIASDSFRSTDFKPKDLAWTVFIQIKDRRALV